jgi:hypothetical protein
LLWTSVCTQDDNKEGVWGALGLWEVFEIDTPKGQTGRVEGESRNAAGASEQQGSYPNGTVVTVQGVYRLVSKGEGKEGGSEGDDANIQ